MTKTIAEIENQWVEKNGMWYKVVREYPKRKWFEFWKPLFDKNNWYYFVYVDWGKNHITRYEYTITPQDYKKCVEYALKEGL